MRAYEFVSEDITESWKKAVAGLAGAGALALGAQGAINSTSDNSSVQRMEIPKERIPSEDFNTVRNSLATPIAQTLIAVARSNGLDGEELAQFLAQCAHETMNFKSLRELGEKSYFKRYDIRHNPSKAKLLGNTRPGDGERYLGRGFIQITGKDNYTRVGKALGIPLAERPELAERPDIAAKIAVWFWQNRVATKVSDFSNTEAATKPINSALRGIDDRHRKFVAISRLIGV